MVGLFNIYAILSIIMMAHLCSTAIIVDREDVDPNDANSIALAHLRLLERQLAIQQQQLELQREQLQVQRQIASWLSKWARHQDAH